MNTIQLPLQPTLVDNPLVNVFNTMIDGIQQLAVNARDLHSFLKVGRDFSNWIKGRINQYVFVENQDFITVQSLSSPDLANAKSRSQVRIEYHLTLDMAKELAMVENNEQGRKVRRYFIQCEKAVYKSDAHQRQALVTACDKLAVGTALRSDVYKMVGNHFGYEDVVSIPTPLLPEAVAFVYELLLAKKTTSSLNEDELLYNEMWRKIGLTRHQENQAELHKLQSDLDGIYQRLAKVTKLNSVLYDAFVEPHRPTLTQEQRQYAEQQAIEFLQHNRAIKQLF